MATAVWGMEFYSKYLRGKYFTLYTDHKPLEKLGNLHTKTLNHLQLDMLEYDFLIQYKKVLPCMLIFFPAPTLMKL